MSLERREVVTFRSVVVQKLILEQVLQDFVCASMSVQLHKYASSQLTSKLNEKEKKTAFKA